MPDANTTIEIYKLMVEDVREARRARRELSNVFMTLNIAGMGALGFLARPDGLQSPLLFSLCAFALAFTCFIWRTSNGYYTVLLRAKYDIIYKLEDALGTHPIRDEWESITGKRRAVRWFSLERAMPLLFIIGYAVFFAVQIGGDNIEALSATAQDAFADILRRLGVN